MVRLGGRVALSAQAERAAVVTGLLVRLGGLRIRRMADGLSVRRTADTGLPLGWAAGFLFVALCFFFGTTRLLVQTGLGRLRAPFAPASFPPYGG